MTLASVGETSFTYPAKADGRSPGWISASSSAIVRVDISGAPGGEVKPGNRSERVSGFATAPALISGPIGCEVAQMKGRGSIIRDPACIAIGGVTHRLFPLTRKASP
jgi:hypothetical protein